MLKSGYYQTKGGQRARLDNDIALRGLGVVLAIGYVAYCSDGTFTYKESYRGADNDPGNTLDLLIETWEPLKVKETAR